MTYCSSLQPVAIYNFSEIESTFPMPFWDYVVNCWGFRGMVSICFIGKGEFDWFLHEYEGLLLDWLIFFYICCNMSAAQNILNPFLHFLHPVVLKYFRIFVTVPNATHAVFHCPLKFSTRQTLKRILLILLRFACMVAGSGMGKLSPHNGPT